MQLSTADRYRIIREEVFRETVRKECTNRNKKNNLWNKLFRWLNEPLGLWVLSAILVGGITEFYKQFQTEQSEIRAKAEAKQLKEKEQAALIGKIDAEITLRLHRVGDKVLAFGKGKLSNLDIEEVGKVVHYPDFKERSITSLMFELQGLLKDSAQIAVRTAMTNWLILIHWEAHKGFAEKNGKKFQPVSFFFPLLAKIYIPRWRKDIDAIIKTQR